MHSLYSLIQVILVIASLAFIIGLIRPTIVIRWGAKQTRGRVLLYYGLGIILFTIISDLVKPEEIREQEKQQRVEQLKKEKEKEQKAREQAQKEQAQKEQERQQQLQQAQATLEKAKQQLNLARNAYKSGNFKQAITSAQQATNTLNSISHILHILIPEASTLNNEAMTLLANAQEALANMPDYILSANRLIQEYENNQVAADSKFKGKIVLISGKIHEIKKSFGTPVIVIGGNDFLDGIDGVRCLFSKDNEPSLARLSKGQQARIKGKVFGLSVGNVRVTNCSLQ